MRKTACARPSANDWLKELWTFNSARLTPVHAGTTQKIAVTALLALIALGVVWELWLAPLRPHGSWLALKVLPLVLALNGAVRGRVYTYKWASMLALAYVVEA